MQTPKPPAHSAATTHKDRAAWFYERASYPLRDAPPIELEKCWAARRKLDLHAAHQWQPLGPFNIAGRVTSLVADPRNPKKLFAGSAAGGVWVSDDRGRTWEPCWGRFINHNIGALAIRSFGDSVELVAATGEANLSPDNYPGSGVFVSRDEGITWNPLFTPAVTTRKVSLQEDARLIPRRVGQVAFDLNGGIALCSVSHDDNMPAGLYLYDKFKGLLPCLRWGNRGYNCYSVLFHPTDPGIIYTAVEPRGSDNGIWQSRDAGKTWTQLTNGLPSGDNFGRTTLAMAPSDPNVIYALASNRSRRLLGVFRTIDGGETWKNVAGERFPEERLMSYNSTIAVHPENPEIVVWGGMKLHRTRNAGRHWRTITRNDFSKRNYVHDDHHALVMPGGGWIYSGNDGGVAVSNNWGETWSDRSRGMVTAMFYSLDVAPSDSRIFGGGTQDNGTLITGVGGKEGEFVRALPGDGATIAFDPMDARRVFGSAQEFFIYRHRGNAPWTEDGWKPVRPANMPEGERLQRSFAVLALDPTGEPGVKRLWGCSNRLWATDNDGRAWQPVTASFDGSVVSAIAISPHDLNVIVVGTTRGGLYRSVDRGLTWTQNIAGGEIPRRIITRILIHPHQPRTLAIAVGAAGLAGARLQGGLRREPPTVRYSRVFLSEDLGSSWKDIDAGALPNVVFNSGAWETIEPYRLFVAGDAGVYVRQDRRWLHIHGNLPQVVISDIVYHHNDRLLTVGTYGRGAWRLPVPAKFLKHAKGRQDDPDSFAVGLLEDPRVQAPTPLAPADGAVFNIFPRFTPVSWTPVEGAVAYVVHVQALLGGSQWNTLTSHGTKATEWTIDFVGAQPGRWRVAAVLTGSRRSRVSEWRGFNHLQ